MTPEDKAEFDATMLANITKIAKKHSFMGLTELSATAFSMMIEAYIQGAKEALVVINKHNNGKTT